MVGYHLGRPVLLNYLLDHTNTTEMCRYISNESIADLQLENNVSFTNCIKNFVIDNYTNNTTICECFFKTLKQSKKQTWL